MFVLLSVSLLAGMLAAVLLAASWTPSGAASSPRAMTRAIRATRVIAGIGMLSTVCAVVGLLVQGPLALVGETGARTAPGPSAANGSGFTGDLAQICVFAVAAVIVSVAPAVLASGGRRAQSCGARRLVAIGLLALALVAGAGCWAATMLDMDLADAGAVVGRGSEGWAVVLGGLAGVTTVGALALAATDAVHRWRHSSVPETAPAR